MTNKLKTPAGQIKFSFKKTIWLYLMIGSSFFIDFSLLKWENLYLFIILLFISVGIGHSVGLHRGIIHKSYITNKAFRTISLYAFLLTGLGSPLSWLKQHYYRDFWQNRKDCPRYFQYKHSLFTDYIWNLHLTFIPQTIKTYNIPKEDLNDPFLKWLDKTWVIHYLIFQLLLYYLIGFNSMLILTSFRTTIIILGHWYIGYASHKYGYYRHTIENADESGYNDIFLGLISFGEGFHNNHHSYPSSAKFSSKWYEIDFGWLLILGLKKFKIISSVKTQINNLKPTAKKHNSLEWKFPNLNF